MMVKPMNKTQRFHSSLYLIVLVASFFGGLATKTLGKEDISARAKNQSELSSFKSKIDATVSDVSPSVVRILGAGAPGSGVIVSKNTDNYAVLTAAHVVKGTTQAEITTIFTSDGIEHRASKVEISPWIDLAIIHFTSKETYVPIHVANAAKLRNEFVVVIGYPLDRNKLTFVPAQIIEFSSNLSVRKGGYTLGYYTRIPALPEWNWTSNTTKGMSGGPVVDLKGNLVAIHGEADQLPTLDMTKNVLGSNSGMSLGIPAQVWQEFKGNLEQLTQTNYLTKLKQIKPSVDELVLKATRAESEGRLGEAISLYSQAISFEPKEGSHYANRARVRSDSGDSKGALLDHDKAVQLFPNSWQIFAMRGFERSKLANHKGAQEDFQRSLALNRTYYRAVMGQMRDLIASNHPHDASRIGEKYINELAIDSNAALLIGTELVRAYSLQNKNQQALDLLEKLSTAQPAEILLAIQAYQVYLYNLKSPAEGLAYLRKKLPRFSTNTKYLYELSIAELNYGRPDTAAMLLSRLLGSGQNDATLHRFRCYALEKSGKLDDALLSCQNSLKIDSRSALTYRYQGLVLSGLGRHLEAVNSYSKSLDLSNPKSAIDYLNRGEARWILGNQIEACADFKKSVAPNVAEKQTPNELKNSWQSDFIHFCSR